MMQFYTGVTCRASRCIDTQTVFSRYHWVCSGGRSCSVSWLVGRKVRPGVGAVPTSPEMKMNETERSS